MPGARRCCAWTRSVRDGSLLAPLEPEGKTLQESISASAFRTGDLRTQLGQLGPHRPHLLEQHELDVALGPRPGIGSGIGLEPLGLVAVREELGERTGEQADEGDAIDGDVAVGDEARRSLALAGEDLRCEILE